MRHRRAPEGRYIHALLDFEGVAHRLLAQFDAAGLLYACEIEGNRRAWRRDRGETGDGFERRVIGHLLADDEALAA
jgi:hypothetical protein